jgi:hypothetical protein
VRAGLLKGGANHLLFQVVKAGFLSGNNDTVSMEKERIAVERPFGWVSRQNIVKDSGVVSIEVRS